MNRSGSGSCTQPERDGDNSSIEQEPGRPGSPAPKALESGRTHRPKKATERLTRKPPQVEATIPTRRKNKLTLRKQDPANRDLGSRKKKNGTFLNHNAFRRVKAVTTSGTENGLKKERDDSVYGQARKGTRAES